MTFSILDQPIRKIGVIGSGQIGPDIALYFSKIFHRQSVPVTVVDISEEALAGGRKKLDRKVDRGVESGAFSPEMGQAMKDTVQFTSDYGELAGVDLVVEAATEDRALKGKIFTQLAEIASPQAIFASNSSHLEPEAIFEPLADKSRTLVVHYFFPAERNPIVEVVPGRETDPKLADAVARFYEAIGKFPITVGSRYGYAMDPIFEGMFQAAALLMEEGVGTSREIDTVATRALGLTVGPFTAMNLTGGNPITNVGLDQYTQKIMPWFRSPQCLKDAVANGTKWDTPKRGETVEVSPEKEKAITESLRGAYFGLVTEILASGISNVADLDMATEIALDMAPPFRLMNEVGVPEALRLVEAYAAKNPGFVVAEPLKRQAESDEAWDIPVVLRDDVDGVAVLTIRRPKVLNALSVAAFDQLEAHCAAIADDPSVKGVVLTAFGVKAFVSGADVNFLAEIDSAAAGERTSQGSQASVAVIENIGKPTVCALNGFAFGGGIEIAMACNDRIARKGLKVMAAQPEPNLGIIPGAGGTQRLPRWVGVEKAAELLRTGRPISGAEALSIGLISEEIEGDLVAAAVERVQRAISGEAPLPQIERGPIDVPETLPAVDIGHLSKAVDAILSRAILEGCKMPLADGLAHEAKLFGEVCETKDMRIGLTNFLKNGPRAKAEFVHA